MSRTDRPQVEETALRAGLGVVFPAGFGLSLALIAAGVLLPLLGLEAFAVAATAGVITLLLTPAAALMWVSGYAGVRGDTRLLLTAVGILLVVAAGVLVSTLR